MNNFIYHVDTKIYFGSGEIQKLRDSILTYGKRVLFVYGGGSIKKIGLYDEIYKQLVGIEVYELAGVDPNPRLESVVEGQRLCAKYQIDVVLAVGGGSSLDCAKAVCAAAYYQGNPWDFIVDVSLIQRALPLVTIVTLAATGSEMDATAVITNVEEKYKKGFAHESLLPRIGIMDPNYTFSVSKYQSAAGTADIMSHVMETYFNHDNDAYLSNEIALAILKTCVKYGPIAYHDPTNYEARANLMWASSLAINGLIACGITKKWSCHAMEHVLSAYFDVTHGAGLAVLTPHWMRHVLDETTLDKFVEFGIELWHINGSLEKIEIAHKAIDALENYFHSLELPKNFADLGVDATKIEEMANQVMKERGGYIDGFKRLNYEDVVAIYKQSL